MAHVRPVDIEMRNNEDFYAEAAVEDANGAPLVISDFNEWVMQVRTSGASETVVLEFSTGNGRLSIPTEGTFAIEIEKEAFVGIPVGRYVQDLRCRLEGSYAVLWAGNYILEEGVTEYDDHS